MNEAPEGAEGVEVPQEEASSGIGDTGTKTVLIAMIAVLVLAFQIVSSHILVKMFFFKPNAETSTEVVEETKPDPIGEVYSLEGILVNPKSSRGTKHLMVDIGMEVSDPTVVEEITRLEPVLRDNIVTVLSSQPLEVLTDITMRDKIRDKIMQVVNYYLTTGTVEKVYFIRYVFP